MGLSGAVIFNSAAGQMRKSAQNLQAINEAKRKRTQEDEIFDLNKQAAQIKLKQAAAQGQTTDIQNKILQGQMDEYFKQQETINKGKDAQISAAEHQETQDAQQAGHVAKTVYQNDPTVRSMVAQNINPRLAETAGPDGGMVQGQDAGYDNTQPAVPSSLESTPTDLLEPTMGKGGAGFKTGSKDYRAATIGKKIDALKASGVQLTPDEQTFDFQRRHPKYSRDAVLKSARQMALDEAKGIDPGAKGVGLNDVKKMIPQAEQLLYGESMSAPQDKSQADVSQAGLGKIKSNAPSGKVKVLGPDGKHYWLPQEQLDQAKKQGFKEAA